MQPLSPKKTVTAAAIAAAQATSSSLSVTPVPSTSGTQEEAAAAASASVSGKSQEAAVPSVKEVAPVKAEEVPFVKPVPGSTLRCLEDPIFADPAPVAPKVAPVTASIGGSTESEGRDRFDRFWGGVKDTAEATGGDQQKTAN